MPSKNLERFGGPWIPAFPFKNTDGPGGFVDPCICCLLLRMTHHLTLESIWLISLSLFPYMHKYDSSFIISPMDMAILHAKLVWLSVATITTSFSIWLRLSIETLNQYSQNESWLRLSIETLNHPPKTTIVSSPSLFVTVTNEDRDWPVYEYTASYICVCSHEISLKFCEKTWISYWLMPQIIQRISFLTESWLKWL